MPKGSLPELLETLKEDEDEFKTLLKNDGFSSFQMELSIPKFKIETLTNFKDTLQASNVSEIFNQSADSFENMTDKKVYVSQILQKAVFEFNEEGAEAAAATAVFMNFECAITYPSFTVDKPFMFALVTDHGIPLFVGHVVDPR